MIWKGILNIALALAAIMAVSIASNNMDDGQTLEAIYYLLFVIVALVTIGLVEIVYYIDWKKEGN